MPGWLSRPGQHRRLILSKPRQRALAFATAGIMCAIVCAPSAAADPGAAGGGVPSPKMYGYAKGPAEHLGTAAGRPHYVPASDTRAAAGTVRLKGHKAPVPGLVPPPEGSRTLVTTGTATMAPGHTVTGDGSGDAGSASPSASPSPSDSASPSSSDSPSVPASSSPSEPSPTPSVSSPASTPAALTAYMSGGTDNASYSVSSTFDTVPMANQSGRIAVTLTNTGTSTWSGYGLAALVFASGNTSGTGTPLATGPTVGITDTVGPAGTTTVEGVTPAENPGSYEICWDVVNDAGATFRSEGASQFCSPYTIQQFPPQVNEQVPLPGTAVNTQTPQLSASAIVPGGFPANPSFTFAFRILNGPNPATASVVASSGWVANNGTSWTTTTNLTWGTTYYWQATVSDAVPPPTSMSGVTWTTPISFVIGNAQPSVFNRLGNQYHADDGDPIMTSDLGGGDYSGSGKTIDPRTGNLSQQATDATVSTVGPPLTITRTYNSLDPRTTQALGSGWSSVLDMSLVPDADGSGALILTMPDGRQVRFAKNAAGGYAPPQDMYAVVSALSGGGFAVTDQTDTTYQFGQASGTSWLISAIIDNTGKAETFGYTSGTLATITSTTSARALHLTWSTPTGATVPHVATIATDPVTAGSPSTALTWTYGYNGDLLSSVCPPGTTTSCTGYGYITNGSHGPTAVMNSDPTSYYRLNDATGSTTAANQIPVNDMTTVDPPATEFNTTLGVPGPYAGVTATSFNGTSSWIPLDGTWCTSAVVSSCKTIPANNASGRVNGTASLGVSIWFKTTATSGILLGLTSTVPSGTSTVNEPLLWIASNGHLDGYGGGTTTMTSPAAVNNGAWHQAVLIPGSALYLDGVTVATATAGFSPPSSAMALLGAGTVSNGFGSSWQFFNGSLADVSIYHNQLPSVGTVAAQYAAETQPAAELNSITSPAGRSELSATYDIVNDRVASLTDAAGGAWNYSGPVTGSSTAAYASTVMGSSPLDFWPLSDTAGPTALDMTGTSPGTAATPRPPATYANVTLGTAGPDGISDGNAASFGGTSSQVTIPGGYFAGTGAESAELWFKTSGSGTLLSSSGGTNGEPMGLAITSGSPKCLEGTVGSTTLDAPVFGACPASAGGNVSDGKWHHAILTMSPGLNCPSSSFGCSPGSFSQTATLYLDGVQLATANITTQATASATGYTATIGNGSSAGQFTGSIADVSLYDTQLTASDVTGHYNALKAQLIPSGVTAPTTPPVNTQTVTVTNPATATSQYVYASGVLVKGIGPLGGVTTYGYDVARRAVTITDADGNTTYVTYDAHNNVTSTTTCEAIGNCQSSYAAYFENLSNPLDPRNDKPTDSRDARSSSPSDPAYDTVTAYTATGQIASQTTPPTPACPAGCSATNAYTTGSEAAAGGGTEPAGLLASVTSPGGATASYMYDSAGDVAQTTDALGLVTNYTYDNIGRKLTQTQVSDSYPAGLTTGFSYDSQGRLVTETDPPVTDRVTGAVHTRMLGYTYDSDSNVLTTTISDTTGGDPSRTVTDAYNARDQLASAQDAVGNTTSYTYNAFGDTATVTDPAGKVTAYAYDAAEHLLTTTLQGYTGNPGNPIPAQNLVQESRAYDPAGRVASVTDVLGSTTGYTYYGDNLTASSFIVCSGCPGGKSHVTTFGYDAAGNVVTRTTPGGLVTNTVLNAANQVVSLTQDPSGADQVLTNTYNSAGNVVSQTLAGGGVTQTSTATYNALGQELTQTNHNTGGDLTTSVTRDQRGLVISQTDPKGNTTLIANDEAGQPAVATGPAVQAQPGDGSGPVTANPVSMTGYDTFGDAVESADPDGNVTRVAYDTDGREASVTDPSYTPPGSSTPVGGTTSMTYDNLGQQTAVTDPLGRSVHYSYDQLGDMASQTDPDNGVWTFTYDQDGNQTSVTDPTGAQTQATYDNLGEQLTSTQLVRQNVSAAYTTTFTYNDAGEPVNQTSPSNVTTSSAYNALGELTSSTDGAGNTTTYAYDLNGDLTKATRPDGTATTTTYDLIGRPVSTADLSAAGAVLRTASAAFDLDSNVTSVTDYRGNTSTASYDATGMITSRTQPVTSSHSITTSYGYDLAGNLTALTDGNGNTTYTTYNSRGLPQAVTQPATAAHGTTADRVTTDVYDADGRLVTQDLPGGVQVSSSYDTLGDVAGLSGTGAAAPTATRTYTYDGVGRLLTAATGAAGTSGTPGYQPATSESFGYDDRGLLLSAAGSAGTSAYTYNASGQLASAATAAGTSSYSYDTAGRLATDADAASGATGSYSYNTLDQVTQIGYGTGKDTQSFGYDNLHRLTSDTIATSGGTQVASIGYGYDANDNVTSMTTSGLATAGGGTGTVTNTYGYDQASRLTSWTATPAGGTATTKNYGYDDAGNMTSNNGVSYSYDTRNELTSDGSASYTYTADGDLATTTSSGTTSTYSSDALGQQVTDAGSQFSYDALGRLVSAASGSSTATLTYDGMSGQIASDPSASYSRDPAGALTGVHSTAGGQVIALVNQHDDVSGTFTATGTALASSSTWDPWGNPIASAGPALELGYQGQWTDPGTGQVNMGSRFYKPSTGGFINADTAPPAGGNLHSYAGDNPVTVTDPTGHDPSGSGSGSGSGSTPVTKARLDQARAQAKQARQQATRAENAATQARNAATAARNTASAQAQYARDLNQQASELHRRAELASQAAKDARGAANNAYATYQQAQQAATAAAVAVGLPPTAPSPQDFSNLNGAISGGGGSSPTVALGPCAWVRAGTGSVCVPVQSVKAPAASTSSAAENSAQNSALSSYRSKLADYNARVKAAAAAQDTADEDKKKADAAKKKADGLKKTADGLWSQYQTMHNEAVAAQQKADYDQQLASQAQETANSLTIAAVEAEQNAAEAEALYEQLLQEYNKEHHRGHNPNPNPNPNPPNPNPNPNPGPDPIVAPGAPGGSCPPWSKLDACRKANAAAAQIAQGLARVVAGLLNAVLGPVLNSIASCITHPTWAGCAVAVGNIILIGAGFADIGADAAEDGGLAAGTCGMSFTPGTKVLLADGKAVPISQLKPGDKVLATNVKTGKTQPETVTAVLAHHDANLYDLKIRTESGTSVIHTTSNHLFWDPYHHYWIPANKLRKGERLKTPSGTVAIADGGTTPKVQEGWMWDLTVPGNNDHDFYVETASTSVLVHNDGGPLASQLPDLTGMSPQQAWQVLESHGFTSNNNVSPNGYETYSAPDGSKVTLRYTDGRVTRTAPATSSEGKRYNARYGPDGARTQAHDTGENLSCG